MPEDLLDFALHPVSVVVVWSMAVVWGSVVVGRASALGVDGVDPIDQCCAVAAGGADMPAGIERQGLP